MVHNLYKKYCQVKKNTLSCLTIRKNILIKSKDERLRWLSG